MNLSLGGVKEEYAIVGTRMTGGLKWEKSVYRHHVLPKGFNVADGLSNVTVFPMEPTL
jgi:hypothetical protein